MPAVTVIVGKGSVVIPGRTSIGGFVIDAVEVEEHTLDSEVTSHPIEKGSNVTDNIVNLPETLVLDCTVTDTPMGEMIGVRRQGIGSDPSMSDLRPSDQCYAVLKKMRKDAEPITIITSLGTSTQMAIKNIGVARRARDGGALKFRGTFQELIFVETERATVADVSTPGGQSEVKGGHVTALPATKSLPQPPPPGKFTVDEHSNLVPAFSKQDLLAPTFTQSQDISSLPPTAGGAATAHDVKTQLGSLSSLPSGTFDSSGNFIPN